MKAFKLERLGHVNSEISNRGRTVANEIIREIGATESVAVMMRRLCEDAASNEDCASILLDGPSVADLLLDAKEILVVDPTATADPMYIQPATDDEHNEAETVFYPPMDTATSCVITLQTKVSAGGKKSSIDTFLANLSNSYRGAKREDNSLVKLRISLIAEQNKGPQVQALEFRAERDYWGLIAAISRALVRKETSVNWAGVCELPSASSGLENTGTTKQKILSIFTGVKAKLEVDKDKIEVNGTSLKVITQNGAVGYFLDLLTLRALAITADWVEPKPYILEVKIASESDANGVSSSSSASKALGGVRLALMGMDLEPVSSPQYYRRNGHSAQQHIGAGLNENILLPLSLQEVSQCKSASGLTSIAVLTGTRFNAAANTPAGIHTIPYTSFLLQSASAPRRASIVSYSKQREAAPPPLRLNDPIVASVPITQDAPRRTVRITIASSSSIPSSRMGAPSAYCAVYLVDDKNNRLCDSSGTAIEAKTDVVKGNNNPVWNKVILIEMPTQDGAGDTVSGVVITVKDAGGGLLKPLHLGQVTVPIGCFIEGYEAQLCLPLEPTPRMPKTALNLGEIHIATQLVTTGGTAGDYSGSPGSPSSPAASPTITVKSAASGSDLGNAVTRGRSASSINSSIPVCYTLRPAFALGVSWPFRILSQSGQGSQDTGGINTGHLSCGQTSLRLALSPGHGGVLACCQEGRIRPSTGGSSYIITIDWSQVTGALALTEASLMLSVIVHKTVPLPGGGLKSEGSSAVQSPRNNTEVLDLLVAPCPSRKLQEALLDRQALAGVRTDLKQLVATVSRGAGTGGGPGSSYAQANPHQTHGRNRQASSLGLPSGAAQTGLPADAVLPVAKVVLSDLEKVVDAALQDISGTGADPPDNDPGCDSNGYSHSGTSQMMETISLAPCALSVDMLKVAAVRRYARARLYQAVLIHACRSLVRAPVYTIEGVRAIAEADCNECTQGTPLVASALAEALPTRLYRMTESAVQRVTDYILCSAEHWNGGRVSDMDGDGANRSLAPRAVECLTELIRIYQLNISGLIASYIASPEAFKRTPGQEAKMTLLKIVMYHDDEFDTLVHKKLQLMGLVCNPSFRLLGRYSLQELASWYQQSLVAETQTWLAKTIQNFSLFKLNTANLPWDIEEVGGRMISALPETLQQQMNLYIRLIESDLEASDAPTPAHAVLTPARRREIHAVLLRIQGKISEAVANCMLLLSDEYRRALQSKHWEKTGREGDDLEKNFHFLISVCNDCLRVSAFQIDAQLSRPGGVGGSELHTAVVVSFMATADVAVKYLVRIIFGELLVVLADFDDYWSIPAEQCTRTIITTLNSYFTHLRPHLDERFVDKLLSCCASIVSTRFLLLLRDRGEKGRSSGHGGRFTPDEVRRYCQDVALLRQCFSNALEPSGRPVDSMKSLGVLGDVSELLSKPLGEIKSLMRVVAKEHQTVVVEGAGAQNSIVLAGANLLRCCIMQMRPDCSAEMEATSRAAVDEASKVPPSWHPFSAAGAASGDSIASMEQSVVQRVFGHGDPLHRDKSGAAGAGPGEKSSVVKQLREKATNALSLGIGKKKRKMEEEDVRVLRLLGLDMDLMDENDAALGLAADDEDDRSSIAGSAVASMMGPNNPNFHIDEANLVIVTVSLIRVQGLHTASVFGGANPYIAVTLGGTRVKTAVAWNSTSGKARWDCALTFRMDRRRLGGSNKLNSSSARIKLEVFDKERLRRKRLLGVVSIKLAGLDLFRIESWFALEGGEQVKQQNGEVFLVVDLANREAAPA